MAGHKGVGLRTPRTRAEQIGTQAKGFEGQMPYNSLLGTPVAIGLPQGEYREAAEGAHPQPGTSPKEPTPFTLK